MLTRGPTDKVVINHGELTIEVVEIIGQSVRMSFLATKDISIERGEVLAKQEDGCKHS